MAVDHPADETAQWVILDTFRTEVASGRIRAHGRTSDRFTAKLPDAGRYEYLLYVNGTGDVLESFGFAVRACAEAGLADTGLSGGALSGRPLRSATRHHRREDVSVFSLPGFDPATKR